MGPKLFYMKDRLQSNSIRNRTIAAFAFCLSSPSFRSCDTSLVPIRKIGFCAAPVLLLVARVGGSPNFGFVNRCLFTTDRDFHKRPPKTLIVFSEQPTVDMVAGEIAVN